MTKQEIITALSGLNQEEANQRWTERRIEMNEVLEPKKIALANALKEYQALCNDYLAQKEVFNGERIDWEIVGRENEIYINGPEVGDQILELTGDVYGI